MQNKVNEQRRRAALSRLRIVAQSSGCTRAWLIAGSLRVPVALGRAGIKANKFEGDGSTPRGVFHPVRVWYRADRTTRPRTLLPVRRIHRADAWCEDPADRRYNRPFRRAEDEPGDRLWRDDHLYDLIIELDHNTSPRVARRGSAVFIHLARSDFGPTAGCVALRQDALQPLLQLVSRTTKVEIH